MILTFGWDLDDHCFFYNLVILCDRSGAWLWILWFYISSNSSFTSLQPCDWPVHHYFLLPADVRRTTTLLIVLLVLSSTWEPWQVVIMLHTWELPRLEVGSSRAVAQSLGFTQAMDKWEKPLWRKFWTARLTFCFMRGWPTKIRSLSAHSSISRLSGGQTGRRETPCWWAQPNESAY